MSEDTHAHHILRATAIHNGVKGKLESARTGLQNILAELQAPIAPGDNAMKRTKRVLRMAAIALEASAPHEPKT